MNSKTPLLLNQNLLLNFKYSITVTQAKKNFVFFLLCLKDNDNEALSLFLQKGDLQYTYRAHKIIYLL